jgi:hypothetical protein
MKILAIGSIIKPLSAEQRQQISSPCRSDLSATARLAPPNQRLARVDPQSLADGQELPDAVHFQSSDSLEAIQTKTRSQPRSLWATVCRRRTIECAPLCARLNIRRPGPRLRSGRNPTCKARVIRENKLQEPVSLRGHGLALLAR